MCLLMWFYFDISHAGLNLPFPWLEFLNQTDIKHDGGHENNDSSWRFSVDEHFLELDHVYPAAL